LTRHVTAVKLHFHYHDALVGNQHIIKPQLYIKWYNGKQTDEF